jgi:hypothetical protein
MSLPRRWRWRQRRTPAAPAQRDYDRAASRRLERAPESGPRALAGPQRKVKASETLKISAWAAAPRRQRGGSLAGGRRLAGWLEGGGGGVRGTPCWPGPRLQGRARHSAAARMGRAARGVRFTGARQRAASCALLGGKRGGTGRKGRRVSTCVEEEVSRWQCVGGRAGAHPTEVAAWPAFKEAAGGGGIPCRGGLQCGVRVLTGACESVLSERLPKAIGSGRRPGGVWEALAKGAGGAGTLRWAALQ